MFQILVISIIFISQMTLAASNSVSIPAGLQESLQEMQAGMEVMVATSCQFGERDIEAFGLLFKSKGAGKSPMKIGVGIRTGSQWKVHPLSTKVEYEFGSDPDILVDFWANGVFVGPFAKGWKNLKHLCFSASRTYNSWACFSIGTKGPEPLLSFVQMNAD